MPSSFDILPMPEGRGVCCVTLRQTLMNWLWSGATATGDRAGAVCRDLDYELGGPRKECYNVMLGQKAINVHRDDLR